ncbi:OadG family transporter subunit [[Clostridium] hylemonae]|uniref:OadG family transporter subunit n=1 Tax=[Clostridium] hylemonae TaxID=89153 RepID=UPI001FCCA13A|nr:OadG family transporter subunit [[Clostridium] hylemonae]
MLAAVLCFTGCGSKQNSDVEYDKASMEQVTDFLIDYCANADEETTEQWNGMSEFAMEQQFVSAGLPFTPDSFLSAMDAWKAGIEECGDYAGHGDYKYEPSRTELKITTTAEFEKRNADLTFVFKADTRGNLNLDSMTVAGKYTMGEILEKAGLNTVLGMGTVFVVLIFISLIISLFRFIPALQNAFGRKPEKTTEAPAAVEDAPVIVDAAAETDDMELAAVISAAVAAAEGTTTDGFVVRSIRRRPSNKWN